jgi:hypothetical protein
MSGLLGIAADFFEHLTDPAFGREANDYYSLKFQVLMGNDAEAARQLATAPLNSDDVGSMSAAAWLWYLGWRESLADEPPSSEFLDALYAETANPILRLRIVEIGAQGIYGGQTQRLVNAATGGEEARPSWVEERIRDLARQQDFDTPGEDLQRARIEDAYELLSYLIEIGSSESLEAARGLLAADWLGAEALRGRTSELIRQMQLAEQDRIELQTQLGLRRDSR